MPRWGLGLALWLGVLAWAPLTPAADIIGHASVIDGDTIEIRGQSAQNTIVSPSVPDLPSVQVWIDIGARLAHRNCEDPAGVIRARFRSVENLLLNKIEEENVYTIWCANGWGFHVICKRDMSGCFQPSDLGTITSDD